MPSLKQWIQDTIGVDKDIPIAKHNEPFLSELRNERFVHSDDPQDRLFRAHGKGTIIEFDGFFSVF